MGFISGTLGRSHVYTPRSSGISSPTTLRLVAEDHSSPRRSYRNERDFSAVNRAMGTDEGTRARLKRRIEKTWGIREYTTGHDLLNQEDGLVGILKKTRDEGLEALCESLGLLIEREAIKECTVELERTGYVAVFYGSQGTALNVAYDHETEMVLLHRYSKGLQDGAARRAVILQKAVPKRVDCYVGYVNAHNKAATFYLGVKFRTDGNHVHPTLLIKRKRGLSYWVLEGEKATYNSPEHAAADVKEKIEAALRKQNILPHVEEIKPGEKVNSSLVFLAWHTNGRDVGYYKGQYYQAFWSGIQQAQVAVIEQIKKLHEDYRSMSEPVPTSATAK